MTLYTIQFSNGHRTLVESNFGIISELIDNAWELFDLLYPSREGVIIVSIKLRY